MIQTNVVNNETLRDVQINTLKVLSDTLINSFGPYGSFTGITKDNMETIYTKDGHTILSNLRFSNQLERAIKDDIENITRYIVKTVGDGTTSAVILSKIIFEKLYELCKEENYIPADLTESFKETIELVCETIRTGSREATPDDMYKVALISTNNNKEVATNIKNIYEEFGMNVFIDVAVSTSEQSQLKVYDGMTLETGYADTCYMTNTAKGISDIRNPHIYIFQDPIDTLDMAAFFDTIIGRNIITPVNNNSIKDIVPTVIMAPKISSDLSTIMRDLAAWLYGMTDNVRPPILVITNIYDDTKLSDIAHLCNAKVIKKYLDPKLLKADQEKGLAPTIDTITEFYGEADEVVSDAVSTKVINPIGMRNEDGSNSDSFNTLLSFLEAELKKAQDDGEDANVTGNLKRRINSLKSNMVEYLVGGISTADRDSVRHSVEDAVLNCRSASANGIGYGANFEGLRALYNLYTNNENKDNKMIEILYNAYRDLAYALYSKNVSSKDNDHQQYYSNIIDNSINNNMPFNIRTKSYDGNVLSSIESDPVILEGIAKIVTIMFSCNQFELETPLHNVYSK